MEKPSKIEFARLTPEAVERQLLELNQLVFEVTDQCNLTCKYCGYGELYCSYDNREAKKLSFEKAKILIDYLTAMWQKSGIGIHKRNLIVSFYGGEPLLNVPLIKQIQDYLEANFDEFIEFDYSMTTNAMLLDRYMDFIVEKNFSLLISLDGDKESQGYRIDYQGQNSFDRVFKNVKLLQEKYPDYFDKRVNFNTVLHDRNNTADVYRFMKQEFGKSSAISELNTSGIRPDKKEQFRSMFLDKQTDFYKAMTVYPNLTDEMFYDVADTKTLYLYLNQFSGNIYKSYMDLLVDKSEIPYIPSGTCLPFGKKMFLTVNGKILPCERIDQKFVLGYVDDGKVDLDPEKIADFYNGIFDKLEKQCVQCYRQKFCVQCIFYIEDIEIGAACNGFMNKELFDNELNNQMVYLRKNPRLYKRIIEELAIY